MKRTTSKRGGVASGNTSDAGRGAARGGAAKASSGARGAAARSLSHVDAEGRAAMVNVGEKPITERVAVAEGFVRVSRELAAAIQANAVKKGNVLEVARLAGVMAAKRTDELIPLCHSLPLDHVEVTAVLEEAGEGWRVRLTGTARVHSRTGVEMEAFVAVTVAALTVIDMGKAVDPGMVIEGVRLLEKRGGRSGVYVAGA